MKTKSPPKKEGFLLITKKKYPKLITIIKGGKERSDSSLNALKFIKKYNPKNVYIHDAARPNFSIKLLKNISKNLKENKAVVPVVNSRDSIKYKVKNKIALLKDLKSFMILLIFQITNNLKLVLLIILLNYIIIY